jgi:hypothetical protein
MNLSEASAIYLGDKPVTAIFRGAESAWSALVPTGNMIVEGAGTEAVNGVYEPATSSTAAYNVKQFYVHESGGFILLFDSAVSEVWGIHDADENNAPLASWKYTATESDVATPDLATGWNNGLGLAPGDLPAPTVTAELGPP